jgi:glycosyltransferase involved in cell wall biosynthesis
MRIVYLTPSGQLGGAERSLLDLLSSLRQSVPDWSLSVIIGGDGPLTARVAALGVEVQVLPFPVALARLGDAGVSAQLGEARRCQWLGSLIRAVPSTTSYAARLRRTLACIAPDVIHTNGFKMHLLGGRVKPPSSSVVWHVRDYISPRPLMSRLLRRHQKRCTAVIANSESIAADVRRNCDALATHVYTVYNAIDLGYFNPQGGRLDLDQISGMVSPPPETVRIGLVATLARWKGHRVFLEALALLPKEMAVRGYIVGGALYQTSGSQFEIADLSRIAASLGLKDRVGFTGHIEDTAAALRALDIVVHASTQPEPFGRVIVEAMACGRAVVASCAGGAAELFTDGADALGHPPGDVEALAACLKRLISDAALRKRLGTHARLTAEKRFDRRELAKQLVPLYRAVGSRSLPKAVEKSPSSAFLRARQ